MSFKHLGPVTAPAWIADGSALTGINIGSLSIGSVVQAPVMPTVGTWLACDGAVYLKSTYSALATAIGQLVSPYTWTQRHGTNMNVFSGYNNGNYTKELILTNGYYVAFSSGVAPQRSTDGASWSLGTGVTGGAKATANGTGTILATNSTTVLKSTDTGATWTSADGGGGTFNSVSGMAFGNSLWVHGSSGGRIYSSSDGSTWTLRLTTGTGNFLDIVWNGSLFVAVGDNNQIYTSTSGTSWTPRTSGRAGTTAYPYKLIWVAATSKWVLVGVDSGGYLQHSSNGTSWTSLSLTAIGPYSVTYFNSLYIVSGADSLVYTSPDLTTWTERVAGSNYSAGSKDVYHLGVIGSTLYAFGQYYHNYTSTDGITWITDWPRRAECITTAAGTTVAASLNSRFYVSTNSGASFSCYKLSSDGFTPKNIKYLVGPNKFFVCGNGVGLPNIYSSTDGVTWTSQVTSGIATTETIIHVSYVNSVYFASSSTGALYRSATGNTWTTVTLPGVGGITGAGGVAVGPVFYANSVYLVTAKDASGLGGFWRSTDGTTWARLNPPISPCYVTYWEYDAGAVDGMTFQGFTPDMRLMRGNSTATVWMVEGGIGALNNSPAEESNISYPYGTVQKDANGVYHVVEAMVGTHYMSTDGKNWVSTDTVELQYTLLDMGVGSGVLSGNYLRDATPLFDPSTQFRVPDLLDKSTSLGVSSWILAA